MQSFVYPRDRRGCGRREQESRARSGCPTRGRSRIQRPLSQVFLSARLCSAQRACPPDPTWPTYKPWPARAPRRLRTGHRSPFRPRSPRFPRRARRLHSPNSPRSSTAPPHQTPPLSLTTTLRRRLRLSRTRRNTAGTLTIRLLACSCCAVHSHSTVRRTVEWSASCSI